MKPEPKPLVEAGVDLRDFRWMPLDVLRLRDSDLAALADGEAFRAAVLLWCAAWHQIPAASLPNDDRVLAHLAGFGRDLKRWNEIRGSACRGFVLCSDGRLYHPVIAEKAKEAWADKLARRKRTQAATEARKKKGLDRDGDVTSTSRQRDGPHTDDRNVHQGTGTGTGTGKKDPSAHSGPGKLDYPPAFDRAWSAYPSRGGHSNPKKRAYRAWYARVKHPTHWGRPPTISDPEGIILEGVKRYASYCRKTGKAGTEFVMQAATFFGPECHFLSPWIVQERGNGGTGADQAIEAVKAEGAAYGLTPQTGESWPVFTYRAYQARAGRVIADEDWLTAREEFKNGPRKGT